MVHQHKHCARAINYGRMFCSAEWVQLELVVGAETECALQRLV